MWHRVGAVLIIISSVYHLFYLTFLASQKRLPLSMLPGPKDALDMRGQHPLHARLKKERPKFDRYMYLEKFDYWAVFWGIVMMVGTGFIFWFPAFFAAWAPTWLITAALIIHGEEATLAILFLFVVHFYNVHLKPSNLPDELGVAERPDQRGDDEARASARVRADEARTRSRSGARAASLDGGPRGRPRGPPLFRARRRARIARGALESRARMRLGRTAKTLVLALTALGASRLRSAALRFKRYVDEDPRLCATCHQSSPGVRAVDARHAQERRLPALPPRDAGRGRRDARRVPPGKAPAGARRASRSARARSATSRTIRAGRRWAARAATGSTTSSTRSPASAATRRACTGSSRSRRGAPSATPATPCGSTAWRGCTASPATSSSATSPGSGRRGATASAATPRRASTRR